MAYKAFHLVKIEFTKMKITSTNLIIKFKGRRVSDIRVRERLERETQAHRVLVQLTYIVNTLNSRLNSGL